MPFRSKWFAALLCFFALGWTRAHAAETVLELGPLAPATCVSSTDLAAALTRAGFDVAERAERTERAPQVVRITVTGSPAVLSVVVERGTSVLEKTLAPATCETATDVVTAFVTSALAPAPVMDIPPALDREALRKALGDELARRNVQLAMLGIRLTLERAVTGTWSASLTRSGLAQCDQRVALGPIAEIEPEPLRRAATAVEHGVAKFKKCADEAARSAAKAAREAQRRAARLPGREPARLTALRETLDDVDTRSDYARIAGGVAIPLGLGFLTFSGLKDDPRRFELERERDHFFLAAGVTFVAGGTTTVLISENHAQAAALATIYTGIGLAWAGYTWEAELPRRSVMAPLYGNILTSALILSNAGNDDPPITRLQRARRELMTRTPSPERVAEIERDLEALEPTIPRWLIFTPLWLGNLIALVPPLPGESETKHYPLALAMGIQNTTFGLLNAFGPGLHDGYLKRLRRAGLKTLSFGPGPGDRGGLTISGKF